MLSNLRLKTLVFKTILPILALLSVACIKDTSAQQMAPDFTLPDLKGNMVSLNDYRGKIVIVDFWATWCLPCRKTLPELAKLDKKYREKGVVILGLSLDSPESYDNKYISDFKDSYGVGYQILRADKKVQESYLGTENPRIPTLFLIDKKGKIVMKHEGFEMEDIEKEVQELL